MSLALERQNTVTTLQTAAGWLKETPGLVGLFFLIGLLNAVGQLTGLVSIFGSLLGSLAGLIFGGVVHVSAADKVADRAPDLVANAEAVVRRTLSLVGIAIVSSIAAGIAAIFFVIPGIYVALRLGLAPAACVIDDMSITDSLSESWAVAQGNLLKLFGIQLATGLVSVAVVGVLVVATGNVDAITQPNSSGLFVPFLLLSPVTAVLAPITQFAVARVYLENRKDGDAGEGDETTTNDDLTVQPGDDEWEGASDASDERSTGRDDHSDEDRDNYWDDR